jgi:DNA-binding NarL/FixJ family response regulator
VGPEREQHAPRQAGHPLEVLPSQAHARDVRHPRRAAAHLAAAPPGSDPAVVVAQRRAAQESLAQGGPDAGVAYLTRALAEGAPAPVQAEILVELGMAERRTDGPAAARHLRDGLARTTDPVRRGEIALELGRVLWFTDRHAHAQEVLASALEDIDPVEAPELHELLVAELISSAWWRPESNAVALTRLGDLDVDGLHGGRGTEILLATMAHHEYRLGVDRARAVGLARRALASGRLAASGSVAFSYAAYAFPLAGLFDEGLAVCDDSLAQARRRGDVFHVASTYMWRGRCHTLTGDLATAVSDLREAADLSRHHGVRVSWPLIVAFLVDALLERGELEEAARVAADAGFPEELPMNLLAMFFALVRGRLRVELGDLERGLADLRQVGESTRLIPSDNPVLRPWRRWAVDGLRRLGRGDEAHALAIEDLALARRWGAAHGIGVAQRVLGLVSDDEASLREAVTTLAASGAQAEHARALVDLGAALRRANHRSDARAVLREGVDLAHAVGAAGIAERGNDEIAATGARPRKELRTGPDALTASERRVAQMAAEGLTNREIAQTLFVTVKTVEVHLSSVYRKLSIESRTQLHLGLRSTHVPQHP